MKLAHILLFVILSGTSAFAYSPDWQIDFKNVLATYEDSFIAGIGAPAIDGFDLIDIRQPPAPPGGAYIQMRTFVDAEEQA